MGKLVYQHNEYSVMKISEGYVIVNTNGEYRNHGHVKRLKTCKLIIKLIESNKVPNSDYLRGTVLRLSLDENYKNKVFNKIEKDKEKLKYMNISRKYRK